jgi:hypothetical protein
MLHGLLSAAVSVDDRGLVGGRRRKKRGDFPSKMASFAIF